MSTYTYIYNFIQHQISIITAKYDVELDPEDENYKQNTKKVAKINSSLDRAYKRVYNKQSIDQVTLQVINNEKHQKYLGMEQVKKSSQFLVFHGDFNYNMNGEVGDAFLDAIKQLPDIKHIAFSQLRNNSQEIGAKTEDEEEDDEVIAVEEVELRRKLRKYIELRATLNVKRLKILQLQQKLQYYIHLRKKLESLNKVDEEKMTREIELFSENIKVVEPALARYNDDAVIDAETDKLVTFELENQDDRANEFYERVVKLW